MGKRKRVEEKPKVEGEYDLPPKHLKAIHVEPNKKRLIIILHGAQLETVKVSLLRWKSPAVYLESHYSSRSATHSSF